MGVESFLVTALPYSADPAEDFHVSLFVTHRLTPTGGGEGTLAEFPNVVDWAIKVGDAAFQLTGSDGKSVPVTALVEKIVPDWWNRVFPKDLLVRPWETPELAAVPWRTFPAHKMDAYSRLTHTFTALLSPVGPPSVIEKLLPAVALGTQIFAGGPGGFTAEASTTGASRVGFRSSPITSALASFLDAGGTSRERLKERFESLIMRATHGLGGDDPRRGSVLRALELLDEAWTSSLDDRTQQGTVSATVPSVLGQAALDLHLARRFYERPEEQRPYAEQPKAELPGHDRPAPIEPDFHQRCSLLAGTPGLLRELGLVVDLRINDLSRLTNLTWIRADIVVPGLSNAIKKQPAVSCRVSGTTFATVSSSGDYADGALKLGDERRYHVLDLDPDASGLKLERFVRSVPRVVYSALNGDPADAAPATLRSSGFAVARRDRSDRLRQRLTNAGARDAALHKGTAPPLDTESVTRGLRLEVWDDVSGDWHSLHERLIDVEVNGDVVVVGEKDVGFLQGAALTRADESVSQDPQRPFHAHEVLAGWEGWSLSVPPVGLVLVDETEGPGDPPDEQRITPVAVRSRLQNGTLPRLRYGRSYMFRAWAVDLAGNSPPASVGEIADADDAALAEAFAPAESHPEPGDLEILSEQARAVLRVTLPYVQAAGRAGERIRVETLAPTHVDAVNRRLRARLAATAAPSGPRAASRVQRVERVVAETIESEERLIVPMSATVPPSVLERARGAARVLRPGAVEGAVVTDVADAPATQLVTTPHPFLRWDAVLPPAWVPRHPYTEGESLLTVVIRSGVTQAADGTVAISDPGTFAAATVAAHPELRWRGDSQRHLVPPKTSQLESERHGMFDDAFGPLATADDRKAALATSLRESGTFFDRTVADLTTSGNRMAVTGVELHHAPTTDPGALVTLDQIDADRGLALEPGQYVVHDVDNLVVPYLPDPLAHGVAFVFPDAGRDHRLDFPFAVEGVTLPFGGEWPAPQPYRLVLETGQELEAEVAGGAVSIRVPPGERLRMRVSTCLDANALELLGLWRGLPPAFKASAELREAAVDGWLWWLTPAEEVRLVHAVPRPVERPRVPVLVVDRSAGDTDAVLLGLVDVHGPSTERLDVEAAWGEPIDDPAKPGPETTSRSGLAGHAAIGYDEDLVLLGERGDEGETAPLTDGRRIVSHTILHNFDDTKHRLVDYTVRATTRYREYFPPALFPSVDDLSLTSESVRLSVPSSARPPKPVVRDVLPLFRWDESTEPEQPFGMRRTRRSGLRIYLDRPWLVTGEGELLAVVLGTTVGSVSQWAADPVWRQHGPEQSTDLPLVDERDLLALDGIIEPGRPVAPPANLPLVDVAGEPTVRVLGYQPEYSMVRKLWFVDVAFDPGTAFWPFVRLAVARYQPESVPRTHLSPVVVCDFAQLTPERTATLTRPDAEHVRVIVTGAVGTRDGSLAPEEDGQLDRAVVARLERRDAAVDSDLAWVTEAVKVLRVRGEDGALISWAGTLELPDAIPPRRPGSDVDWRVTVEEWEFLPADGLDFRGNGRAGRLVYADHLAL